MVFDDIHSSVFSTHLEDDNEDKEDTYTYHPEWFFLGIIFLKVISHVFKDKIKDIHYVYTTVEVFSNLKKYISILRVNNYTQ